MTIEQCRDFIDALNRSIFSLSGDVGIKWDHRQKLAELLFTLINKKD